MDANQMESEGSVKELYGEIKEGSEKAKAGDISPLLFAKLKKLLEEGKLNPLLHNSFGWYLYFRLRLSRQNDFITQKLELATYLKLKTTRPSVLHSLILHEAIRLKKQTPGGMRFHNFLKMWKLENLREEDWQRFEMKDGSLTASLVEKIIACLAKELTELKIKAPQELIELTDRALILFPDNLQLPECKAAVCKSLGEKEEALRYIVSALLRQPSKSHLWRRAYDLTGKLDLKIAFLSKAITLQKGEAFLGNTRLKLARLLLRKNLPHYALFELRKYHDVCMSNRWSLGKEYDCLRSEISPKVQAEDSQEVYRKYVPLADDFLYGT